jgi:glycosyltransferase involved in cell wall biosynthesis
MSSPVGDVLAKTQSKLRIFHGPNDLGGMAAVLARAQRSLGHDAQALCYTSRYGPQTDGTWPAYGYELLGYNVSYAWAVRRFDIFQFYYAQSLTGISLRDVPWLKRLGKKVFFFFCGCDVRDSKAMLAKHPYSTCSDCWPMDCCPNRAQLLEVAARYGDGSFVSTPDLLESAPGARLLLQPVDIAQLESAGDCEQRSPADPILIVHAPTDRQKKGTPYVMAAIEALRARGARVELRLVEHLPRAEAMNILRKADIIVDQVLAGAYGMLSVEGMALGKPVVCYVREDLWQYYPEHPPVINADPRTVEQVLGELVVSRDAWSELGQRGRQYARRWHDSVAVARRLLEAYQA